MSEREHIIKALGEGVQESMDPELIRAFDVADNKVPDWMKDPEKLRFKEGQIKLSGDGIFFTMQSEGVNMGRPSVFMRLHICNLRCVWCDTPYTWNPRMPEFWTEPTDVPVEDAVKRINEVWKVPEGVDKRLVISGGEPLIQQGTVSSVIDKLGTEWGVEIETNGTIAPSDRLIKQGVQFNVSPKPESSVNSRKARIRPEVLEKFKEGNSYYKFVVMSKEDVDEVERDFIQPMHLPINRVIMMPQGVSGDEVRANAKRIAEYSRDKGYRLLGRLQTEIYGAKRRV